MEHFFHWDEENKSANGYATICFLGYSPDSAPSSVILALFCGYLSLRNLDSVKICQDPFEFPKDSLKLIFRFRLRFIGSLSTRLPLLLYFSKQPFQPGTRTNSLFGSCNSVPSSILFIHFIISGLYTDWGRYDSDGPFAAEIKRWYPLALSSTKNLKEIPRPSNGSIGRSEVTHHRPDNDMNVYETTEVVFLAKNCNWKFSFELCQRSRVPTRVI